MFFLLPIGHGEDTVRRLPWVTITIAVTCLLIHFFNTRNVERAEEAVQEALYEALEYWVERPYLAIPGDLERQAQWRMVEAQWAGEAEGDVREPEADQKAEEQQQLDRMIATWQAARDQVPVHRWGLVPARFEAGDLFAYMFLHAGWFHLIGNLLFLWLSGPPLEDIWGRPFFATFYLAVGVFGGLMWTVIYPTSGTPLIGASGAVAGLMGAFMVRYGNTPVKMFYFILWFLPFILRTGTFKSPAWVLLGLWFGRELYSASLFGSMLGVAFWVHVWGFVFGAGGAWLIRRLRIEQRVFEPTIDAKLGGGDMVNPAIDEAHELRQLGKAEEAWNVLTQELRKNPGNLEANLALWDAGLELGRQQEVLPSFLRCIRQELRSGQTEIGLFHWLELNERMPGVELDLELELRLAEALIAEQRDEEAADLLAGADRKLDPQAPMGLRIRLARAAARSQSASAPALCEPLLENPAVPEKLRLELAEDYGRVTTFGVRPRPAAEPPAAEPQPPAAPADDDAPLPLSAEAPAERVLKVMPAVPRRLTGDKLALDVAGQGARTLPLSRVQAVAVAAIEEGPGSTYVVIDLLVDSLWSDRTTIRTVRLLSQDFDARELLPQQDGDSLQSLLVFIDNVLQISEANPMPDGDAVRGRPFYNFASLPSYESAVFGFTSR